MNRFGRNAMNHWKEWLPGRYGQLDDPEAFFTYLGDEIEEQVTALTSALAGDDRAGEGYLEKIGRLEMARFCAEAQVLREMAHLEPEPALQDPEEPDTFPDPLQFLYEEMATDEDGDQEGER